MTRGLARLVFVLTLIGPSAAEAQPSRSTLTVLAFDAQPAVTLKGDAGARLASDLATRLVETHQFRVLPLEWLPKPDPEREHPALETLIERARAAGVEFVVIASVRRPPPVRVPHPHPLLGLVQVIGGLSQRQPLVTTCHQPVIIPAFLTLDVRVIDAASGSIVRTMSASSTRAIVPARGRARLAHLCAGGIEPLPRTIDASSGSQVDGLEHANGEVASRLRLPSTDPQQDVVDSPTDVRN